VKTFHDENKKVGVTGCGIHSVICGTGLASWCGGTGDYREDNVAGESQAGNATSRAETTPLCVPDRGACKTTPLPPCFISVILYKTSRRLLKSRDEAIKVTIDVLTVERTQLKLLILTPQLLHIIFKIRFNIILQFTPVAQKAGVPKLSVTSMLY
jgi:hypothetical protein